MYSGPPVVDAHNHVLGVVTAFDLLKAIGDGKTMQTVTAAEIMGRPAICVAEDGDIEMVIAKMTMHNFVRVPVARDGKPVGIICRADILSRMIEPEFVTLFDGK
jgi:CBS domain-containing protein